MLGKIIFPAKDCEIEDPNKLNLVAEVSTKEPRVYGKGGDKVILAFDCGIKFNIIRYLVKQGVIVHVVPFDYDLKRTQIIYHTTAYLLVMGQVTQ